MQEISFADQLCIVPIIQQVIGSATILLNSIKSIIDIAKLVFFQLALLHKERKLKFKRPLFITQLEIENFKKGNYSSYLSNYLKQFIEHFKTKNPGSLESDARLKEQANHSLTKFISIQEKMISCRKDLFRHIKYIGIGFIRALPIIGTIYSYRKINAFSRFGLLSAR